MKQTEGCQLLTYGELLLRLSPEEHRRIADGGSLQPYIGGAEFNVAATASQLGLRCGLISAVPDHGIGELARNTVRKYGVDDSNVFTKNEKSRLGIYYYESGAQPRKPGVIYDREHSAINQLEADEILGQVTQTPECFYTSGISLALSDICRRAGTELIHEMKRRGAKIAFDVNYRSNLWSGEEARRCIEKILPEVDIFFCSMDTAQLTFHKTGDLREIQREFAEDYGMDAVVSTQRVVHSPKCHSFSSLLYDAITDTYVDEKPYERIEVADRIGSGDAYVAGALYGLLEEHDTERAVSLGNACSALKHTMSGDIATITKREVDGIIRNHRNQERELEMVR